MISGNFWEPNETMKQLLYFLIGFSFSVFCIGYAYSAELACEDITSDSTYIVTVASDNSIDALNACRAASPTGLCGSKDRFIGSAYVCGYYYMPDSSHFAWFPYNCSGTVLSCSPSGSDPDYFNPDADSDGDGRPDSQDFYPNDPNPYLQKLVVEYYDSNGNLLGSVYETDRGDYFTTGTIPSDGSGAVIKIGTAFETPDNQPLSDDDFPEITRESLKNSGITSIPTTSAPVTPDSDVGTGTKSQSGDTDTALQGKIADNTAKSVDALAKISSYNREMLTTIGKINTNSAYTSQKLSDLNTKMGTLDGSVRGVGDKVTGVGDKVTNVGNDLGGKLTDLGDKITGLGDKIGRIGKDVEDELIDPGQTIDTTTTDNITSLDETDTLTEIKTKYSDRYDLFINTLKGSDLFTEPFDIFTGPSGSGSSVLSVNIGSWGQSSSRTVTIDFSQYNNVWNILSSVLLMLTSFACFKIIVLKKA